MALSKIKSSSIDDGTILDVDVNANAAIGATKLAGTLDLSSKTVTLPEASVTAHVTSTDLTGVRSDIAILALKESAIENRVAYGSNNTFVDHFQDSTGVNAATTGVLKGLDDTLVNASEYVSAWSSSTVKNQWTIEGFFWANATDTAFMLFDLRNNAATKGLSIYNNSNKTMTISIGNGSTMQNWTWSNAANAVWDPSQWQRWAVTRNSDGDISMYTRQSQTGTLYHRLTVTEATYGDIIQPESGQDKVFFGGAYNSNGSVGTGYYIPGYLDELRLSQGICRHEGTGSGFAQSAQWANDSYTKLNLHFDNTNPVVDSGPDTRTVYLLTTPTFSANTSAPFGTHNFICGANAGVNQYVEFRDGPDVFSVADEIVGLSVNATGSVVSTVQTAAATVNEVSGVYLYEDAYGNSTPGTQLKIYFTSNNGVNYYEAASYTASGTFSGNIKMVKLGKTTMTTAGTQVAMKAVWASQVADTMVQHLHGWAVNY